MAKQSAFLTQIQAQHKLETDWKVAKAGFIARQQTLDKVAIVLGMMEFTEEQYEKFGQLYNEVEADYCTEVIEDGNADKTLAYAKDKIDKVLKQYVPERLFAPYDERYDMSDLAKRYGVTIKK